MNGIKTMCHNLVEKHKLIRRLVLIWFLLLVGFGTYRVFNDMEKVNAAVATVYSALVTLNGAIFAFYCQSRNKESVH